MSKHRLTPKLLYSDDAVFIDVFGNAHRGGKQITHNKAVHVEVGKLWKDLIPGRPTRHREDDQ